MIKTDLSEKANGDSKVWKYFNFPSFVNLLLTQNLLFRRVDKFADKLEGTIPTKAQNQYYEYLMKSTIHASEATEWFDYEMSLIDRYKKWCYVNCWSISEHENYALWKIYLDNHNEGIAIRTTIDDLSKSIVYDDEVVKNGEAVIIKDVNYDGAGYNEVNQTNIYSTKYPAYKYESELRLFFKNQRDLSSREKDIYKGFNDSEIKFLKVDLKEMIKGITISPFADIWFKDTVKMLLESHFSDMKIVIEDSEIIE